MGTCIVAIFTIRGRDMGKLYSQGRRKMSQAAISILASDV